MMKLAPIISLTLIAATLAVALVWVFVESQTLQTQNSALRRAALEAKVRDEAWQRRLEALTAEVTTLTARLQTAQQQADRAAVATKNSLQSLEAGVNSAQEAASSLVSRMDAAGDVAKTVTALGARLTETREESRVRGKEATSQRSQLSESLDRVSTASKLHNDRCIAAHRDIKDDLSAIAADLEQRVAKIVSVGADNISQKLAELRRDLSEMQAGVPALSAPELRGGPHDDPTPAPRFETEILAVEATDGIVILGAGAAAGVEMGQRFEVRRDGQLLATVRILTLEEELCGATVLEGATVAARLRAGDRAIRAPRSADK